MRAFQKLVVLAGLVSGLFLATGSGQARASFDPVFTNVVAGPGAGQFTFNYNLVFDSATGTQRLQSGNFVTIYDFAGLVSVIAPTGSFTITTQPIGINAPQTAPNDDPNILNVTLTYTGATLTADTTFTGLGLVTTTNATGIDDYTSTTTRATGPLAGTSISAVGDVTVAVPEPASLALLGVGGLGLVVALRRRAKSRTEVVAVES